MGPLNQDSREKLSLEEMTLSNRTDMRPAQVKMPGVLQPARIVLIYCNRRLVKTSHLQNRFFDGCTRAQDVYLAFKTQHKELQICTWGLKATTVPIHTQSKSRDKYESEKEKLQNFVQVLSTFTHAENLYLSKSSHWLHMWGRITCTEKDYWIWSLLYTCWDKKPTLTKSKIRSY